jgi:hypothetical protein
MPHFISIVLILTFVFSMPLMADNTAPVDWLKTDGKGEDWTKQTANCRELLGKLKLNDARSKQHLPKIEADCAMLRKHKGGFGWREITGVQFLENLLTDLVEGKTPNLRYRGKGVAVAYWSDLMQRIEAIWVHVPPSYDPQKKYQMFMCYKSGGGIHYRKGKATGGYRPTAEVANQTDTFFTWSSLYYGVKGRMCAVDEYIEATAAICAAFSVDPDRIFTTGYSDGGFTDLWLAGYYPHLFAGLAPGVANWQYSNISQIGLLNLPMLVVDGWNDGGYNGKNFVRFHNLDTMGGDVAGSWGHQGHTYAHFEKMSTFGKTLAWAQTKRRNSWPKRVRYATWDVTWHRAYWFTIQRVAETYLPSQIDAEIKEKNRIEVKQWNVAAYRLALSDKLVDMSKPVTVLTDGKISYAGPAKADLLIELTPKPEGKFVKDADTPGGLGCQTVRSWYGRKREGGYRIPGRAWGWVRPTGGDSEIKELLAKWAPEWATDDTAVTPELMAKKNLYLYGGPQLNQLTAKIAADLPVTFGKGWFEVEGVRYDQPGNAVKFIHPNPLNPDKYVIVYAFNDATEQARIKFKGLTGESAWTFRKGDCMVLNVKRTPRQWGVALGSRDADVDHYIFDTAWRATPREKLGELSQAFSYTQVLRLRADALREATGADVGLVWGYAPGYLRWRVALDTGPVTVASLAQVEALPQYIQLCDIKGSKLYSKDPDGKTSGYLGGCPASSTDGKPIESNRTYTVASTYYGLPHYGARKEKIPDPFYFESIAEFLAQGHTSVPYRNLRQIPQTVNEAVAAYIRKRGRVAPRPVVGELIHYLMAPQANEYPRNDWVHVGVDAAWKKGKQISGARYNLAFGLRETDAADERTPRRNSKLFREIRSADTVRFDTLDKKLPVSLAWSERLAHIELKDEVYKVSDTTDAPITCRVLDFRLRNTGKKDVSGVVAINSMWIDRINGRVWPNLRNDRPLTGRLAGLRWAEGPHKKPPTHQRAIVFQYPASGNLATVYRLPGVGFNSGLVAVSRPVVIKAGETVTVPVILAQANRTEKDPEIKLETALDAIRGVK